MGSHEGGFDINIPLSTKPLSSAQKTETISQISQITAGLQNVSATEEAQVLKSVESDLTQYVINGVEELSSKDRSSITEFGGFLGQAISGCKLYRKTQRSMAGRSTQTISRWSEQRAESRSTCHLEYLSTENLSQSQIPSARHQSENQGQVNERSVQIHMNYDTLDADLYALKSSDLVKVTLNSQKQQFQRIASTRERAYRPSIHRESWKLTGEITLKNGLTVPVSYSRNIDYAESYVDDNTQEKIGHTRIVMVLEMPFGSAVYEKHIEQKKNNKIEVMISLNKEVLHDSTVEK